MAVIRAYCEGIHGALVEANGDWADVTVTQALESADTAYLKKCLGDNHQAADRTKVVTCIQNFRHRLRDEYTNMFGKADAGLAAFLLTTTDPPPGGAGFLSRNGSVSALEGGKTRTVQRAP